MKWIDVIDIAIKLEEMYPDKDVINIRFTDLYSMILKLPGFDDDPKRCNERVLEAIQAAWLDEKD